MTALVAEQPEEAITGAEETLHTMARHVRTVRVGMGRVNWTFGTLTVAILIAAATNLGNYIPPGPFNRYGGLLLLLPFVPPGLRVFSALIHFSRPERSLRTLFRAGYSEARSQFSSDAIGPLLDVLASTVSEGFLFTLTALLKDLLEALRAEDAIVLTKYQRNVLHDLLQPGLDYYDNVCSAGTLPEAKRRPLRLAILWSLGLLGDQTSVPLLEEFAMQTKEKALREAALLSLGQIVERHRYGAEQLLRASRAPDRLETLLRPLSTTKPQDGDPRRCALRAALLPEESEL